jgi:hypothetical protein
MVDAHHDRFPRDPCIECAPMTSAPSCKRDDCCRYVARCRHPFRGAIEPAANDFAMLRLVLLALLPQVGGTLQKTTRLSQRRRRLRIAILAWASIFPSSQTFEKLLFFARRVTLGSSIIRFIVLIVRCSLVVDRRLTLRV